MRAPPEDVTAILDRLAEGDREAWSELVPLVYDELRRLARGRLRRQAGPVTLDPTGLVHEVFARLAGDRPGPWSGREHFLAVAATAMRQVLVDHARRRSASKRGGSWQRVSLTAVYDAGAQETELVSLDAALEKLATRSERQARVVELRVFAGMSVSEVALVLEVSPRTVDNDWRFAKSWLRRELADRG